MEKFKKPDINPEGFDRNEYETPWWLFDRLNQEFDFYCDLAASPHNAKCAKFLEKKDDSLRHTWSDAGESWLWLNPPYSPLKPWIQKAQFEAGRGARVVMLVPNQCLGTRYLHDRLPDEVRFIVGRVNFFYRGEEKKGNATDVCLLVFDGHGRLSPRVSWVTREDLSEGRK